MGHRERAEPDRTYPSFPSRENSREGSEESSVEPDRVRRPGGRENRAAPPRRERRAAARMVVVLVREKDAVDRFRRNPPRFQPPLDLSRGKARIDQETRPARLDDTTVAARARGEDAHAHR